jgi:hypothetical protein
LKAFNYYTEIPTHKIKSLRIFADNTNLYINSKFDTSTEINGVNIYNDPKKRNNDGNYNSISYAATTIINNDSISLVMPLWDINEDYKAYPFELKLLFCHINGNSSYQNFQYQFINNKPDIDLNVFEVLEIVKSDWTVHNFSSEETIGEGANNGHAIQAVDNN